VWRASFSDSSLYFVGEIHYSLLLSSSALWSSDGSCRASSLSVVIHICRNNLLDDTSGPVANPYAEAKSSDTEKHCSFL
jgi:hypothetical protein